MTDQDKTKFQLIDELQKMRKRVAELERNSTVQKNEPVTYNVKQEHEERLRLALDATNDGIWDWNTETGLAYFSPRYYTMLGYEPDEFLPSYDSWRHLIHPDDLEATEAAINNAREKQTSFAVEFRMKAKDNVYHWILSRGKAVEHSEGGDILRMVGSHTNITRRKEIEESLYLARFIIDRANVGIQLIGSDGLIKEVNQKAADMIGYSRAELERCAISDIDPQVNDDSWKLIWQDLTKNESQYLVRQHCKKDGSIIPVEIYASSLEYHGSLYSVAFIQDISERKRNEEILREKDILLHDMQKLVKIGAWGVDVITGQANSTDEVSKIYDLEPGDLTVENGLSFYHGKNRKEIKNALNEAITHGTPYDLELEIVSAKGIHKWVRTTCHPVTKDGRVIKLQGAFQDITDIKNAEVQLKESEGKYRALIELAPLGVGIVNTDEIVVDCNQALASMLGYELHELLGLSVKDITHPDDLYHEQETLQASFNGKKTSYSIEKRCKHKDGHCFWVNITASVAQNICGPGIFVFGFTEDISTRKKLETEREQLINELQNALAEIKELRGFIPICANCKNIRNDEGYWQQVEQYISDRTDAKFSHSLCPDCVKKLYPDQYHKIISKMEK